jgi:hypothetical protein
MLLFVAAADIATARAQGAPASRAGTWEFSGGLEWIGGTDLGNRAADETRNPGTGTGPFPLFQSSSEIASATGIAGRIGFHVSRSIAIEATGRLARPDVSTRLTADAESADSITAEERLTSLVIDGSVVYHLDALAFAGGRAVPFATGGLGYLRELHDGNELIETGKTFHAGGGLKYWFGSGVSGFGFRADVGFSVHDGGFYFARKTRTLPTMGVSMAYRF